MPDWNTLSKAASGFTNLTTYLDPVTARGGDASAVDTLKMTVTAAYSRSSAGGAS
jgi:hypothetical protein